MTHAGRIRLSLIFVAVFPPMLILWYLVANQANVSERNARMAADNGLSHYVIFEAQEAKNLAISIKQMATSKDVRTSVIRLKSHKQSGRQFTIDAIGLGQVDFAEILDSTSIIKSSWGRPGLVGQKRLPRILPDKNVTIVTGQSVEYDKEGPHASLYNVIMIEPGFFLLAGVYLGDQYMANAQYACNCSLELLLADDSVATDKQISQMHLETIYDIDNKYKSLVNGGRDAGFYLVATFPIAPLPSGEDSLIPVAALVALAGVVVALGLGFYITGRTRRETDNLVQAFSRVAGGDFSTPVMAYEEGEFSELADSFSEMMTQLAESRNRLASSQKIAAWQVMGRKVAHEIKNPLTPIAIAVDDMQRSYDEQLPGFSDTLKQNTEMIRSEIRRLTILLDQFVRFARMAPPTLSEETLDSFVQNIKQLYQSEIENQRISIKNISGKKSVTIDSDQMIQVLVNLIKNGLEATDDSRVTVTFSSDNDGWTIAVEDTGPGFSDDFLANPFEPYISSKKNGSGLGLVICQRIVVDHGGVIELVNSSSHGAIVTIRFSED